MRKTRYVLTVTLNPAFDLLYWSAAKRGGTALRERSYVSAGGKGINVARMLRRSGVPVYATGLLPSHASKDLFCELVRSEHIENTFSLMKGKVRINITVTDQDTGTVERYMETGSRCSAQEWQRFMCLYKRLLLGARLVVIAGSSVPGIAPGMLRVLVDLCHDAVVPCILDMNAGALRAVMKSAPWMIAPNEEEASDAVGFQVKTRRDCIRACSFFHARGIRVVAITRGAKGVIASNGEEWSECVPPRIRALHTVGCGDAFVAGFIVGMINKEDFLSCVVRGTGYGVVAAQAEMPGDIRPAEAERMMKRIKRERSVR